MLKSSFLANENWWERRPTFKVTFNWFLFSHKPFLYSHIICHILYAIRRSILSDLILSGPNITTKWSHIIFKYSKKTRARTFAHWWANHLITNFFDSVHHTAHLKILSTTEFRVDFFHNISWTYNHENPSKNRFFHFCVRVSASSFLW